MILNHINICDGNVIFKIEVSLLMLLKMWHFSWAIWIEEIWFGDLPAKNRTISSPEHCLNRVQHMESATKPSKNLVWTDSSMDSHFNLIECMIFSYNYSYDRMHEFENKILISDFDHRAFSDKWDDDICFTYEYEFTYFKPSLSLSTIHKMNEIKS